MKQTIDSGTMYYRAKDILLEKNTAGKWKDFFLDWKWILSFSRSHSFQITIHALLGMIASILSLAGSVLGKYLIDAIVAMNGTALIQLIVPMMLSVLITMAVQSVSARHSAKLHVQIHEDVQTAAFENLLESDWMAISRYSTGDLLNRFSGDVNTVAQCAATTLPRLLISSFSALAVLAVICYYDPIMALIGFASTPALFLLSRSVLDRQRSYSRRSRQISSALAGFQSEVFRNISTLKSFGAEDDVVHELHAHQATRQQIVLEENLFAIRTRVWMKCISSLVQYAVFGYCLWRLWRGEIQFGTLVLFLQQRTVLSDAFSSIVSLVSTMLSGSVAAERVRELIQLPKEAESGQIQLTGPCHVIMEDVQVSYDKEKNVLSGVSFHAHPGEIVALSGPSGAGKTTLMRLLLGLITPERGRIVLCDDAGIQYAVGPDTRRCFTYVPQGNTLLAGSVAKNLRLGKPDATREEMIQALEMACAWDFVSRMPEGLNSVLGEGGIGLSEGQAQRIAIARALMRKAPVMLLDEVTSALDSETEQRVLVNLEKLGITTILITHRSSVLDMCSHAYRVENGRVRPLS